jgi:hypothetical protein
VFGTSITHPEDPGLTAPQMSDKLTHKSVQPSTTPPEHRARGSDTPRSSERDTQRPGTALPDQDECGRIASAGRTEETCMSAADVQPFRLALPEEVLDDPGSAWTAAGSRAPFPAPGGIRTDPITCRSGRPAGRLRLADGRGRAQRDPAVHRQRRRGGPALRPCPRGRTGAAPAAVLARLAWLVLGGSQDPRAADRPGGAWRRSAGRVQHGRPEPARLRFLARLGPARAAPRGDRDLFVGLMEGVLGYRRFGAQGGDWGAHVLTRLAHRHPELVTGLHLNLTNALPHPGDGAHPLSQAESDFPRRTGPLAARRGGVRGDPGH